MKSDIISSINSDIIDNLEKISNRIKGAVDDGLKKIEVSNKGGISIISLSFLRSSLCTKSYDFCVNFFGKDYYNSEFLELSYFSLPEFFDSQFDRELIKSHISGKISGIRDYDYYVPMNSLDFFRLGMIPLYISPLIGDWEFKDYHDILSNEVKFLYGGYMDKTIQIAKYERDESGNEIFSHNTE